MVPFLLGLKFNLAVLLPIFIGFIILLSKKTVFLSKIVLLIINIFGAGGLFAAAGAGGGFHGHGYGFPRPHFGGFEGHEFGNFKSQNNMPRAETETPLPPSDKFYEFEKKKLMRDRTSRLYEREYPPGSFFEERADTQKFKWHTVN